MDYLRLLGGCPRGTACWVQPWNGVKMKPLRREYFAARCSHPAPMRLLPLRKASLNRFEGGALMWQRHSSKDRHFWWFFEVLSTTSVKTKAFISQCDKKPVCMSRIKTLAGLEEQLLRCARLLPSNDDGGCFFLALLRRSKDRKNTHQIWSVDFSADRLGWQEQTLTFSKGQVLFTACQWGSWQLEKPVPNVFSRRSCLREISGSRRPFVTQQAGLS